MLSSAPRVARPRAQLHRARAASAAEAHAAPSRAAAPPPAPQQCSRPRRASAVGRLAARAAETTEFEPSKARSLRRFAPLAPPPPHARRCDAQDVPNAAWRVLSVFPYLVPLMGSLAFGQEMYDTFPAISWLINVFGPMLQAYYSNSFTPFFVFFALFLAVVRNEKLPHFLRFNTMQSILLDICIMLGGLIIQYMPFEMAFSWVGAVANSIVFTTGAAAVFYCAFYTLQGKYAGARGKESRDTNPRAFPLTHALPRRYPYRVRGCVHPGAHAGLRCIWIVGLTT